MTIDLLDGPAAEAEIKKLISSSKTLQIAVPYWGRGSRRRLELDKLRAQDVTIVCDLLSGCCDPDEIKALQDEFGRSPVLTCDSLHAKVWLTDRGAVFGSSNASANGLGLEGTEVARLIEMNALISDPAKLNELSLWFNKTVLPASREIEKRDLKQAKN